MTDKKDIGSQVRDSVHVLGQQAADAVRDETRLHAEKARDAAADRIGNVAEAADAAANTFDADSVQAQAVQHIADRVEDFAQSVRTADLMTSMGRVANFARENPVMFIAGAAMLGFAATRFLKARNPEGNFEGGSDADPWTSHAEPSEVGRSPRLATTRGSETHAAS